MDKTVERVFKVLGLDNEEVESSSYNLTFERGFDGTTAPYFKQRKTDSQAEVGSEAENDSEGEVDNEAEIC